MWPVERIADFDKRAKSFDELFGHEGFLVFNCISVASASGARRFLGRYNRRAEALTQESKGITVYTLTANEAE